MILIKRIADDMDCLKPIIINGENYNCGSCIACKEKIKKLNEKLKKEVKK